MDPGRNHSPTASAGATISGDSDLGHALNRISRRRPQLSCIACRRRKLKCNRGEPCDNCIRRREDELCTYLPFTPRKDDSKDSKRTRAKLDRLEKLVTGLIETVKQNNTRTTNNNDNNNNKEAQSAETDMLYSHIAPPENSITIPNTTPNENGQNSNANVMSSSLWEDVLHDVAEIRDYFDDHDSSIQEQVMNIESSRPQQFIDVTPVFDGHENISMPILIASLPTRAETDRLVAHFFRFSYILRPIVHPKKFQREYKNFWTNMEATPIAWMGLLFSILRISVDLLLLSGVTLPFNQSTVAQLRTRTIECISSTHPSRPTPHLLETLLLHIEAEFISSPDSRVDTWMLTSTAVRVALHNGLHRDPSLHKGISPFEAEMRRRLWLGIKQCDIMMSFQVGLPAMIPRRQADVKLPRNLREEDFDEDDIELPPSRSMDEVTNIAFFLAKHPLLEAFEQIAAYSQDTCPRDEEVSVLEAELERARERLPLIYRVRPLSESIAEPGLVILRRYAIDQIYQTGVCVLHRRHLTRAQSDPRWSSSRKACVDAALTLLSYQSIKYEETKPAGRFADEKLLMNSLDQNSFLLAAMLICLDLQSQRTSLIPESSDTLLWGWDRGYEMRQALQTSANIWNCSRHTSLEAFKASEALSIMLRNLAKYNSNGGVMAVGPVLPEEPFLFSDNINWREFDSFFYN
ncbi:hypothetical protein B7463_g10414, partial [Scytalidium lignicola]